MELKNSDYLNNLDDQKVEILNKLLEEAPFSGWSTNTLKEVVNRIGKTDALEILFPNGIKDLIDLYYDIADKKLIYDSDKENLNEKSIRERINFLINARINFFSENKEVVRQIIGSDILSGSYSSSLKRISHSVDIMWRIAGDKSVDYNYYTKRILLTGIYTSSILFWLDTDNRNEVSKFIDRRIANVMSIEKIKKKLKPFFKSNKK